MRLLLIAAWLLPLCLTGRSQGKGFIHPGMLNNLEEMEFVREKVLKGTEPWKSAYEAMLEGTLNQLSGFAVDTRSASSLPWEPGAVEYIAERRGSPDKLRNDMSAAYIHAWIWFIQRDEDHARQAVKILNEWGHTFKGFKHEDHNPLLAGFNLPSGIYAAEIMRYTYEGWREEDIRAFEKMLVEAAWPAVKDGADRPEQRMKDLDENHPNGNWEATTMAIMMSIAIFTNDEEKFNHALRYWYGPSPSTGNPKGRLRRYIWGDGQCQETCRDLVHTQVGMSALTHVAEMAWKQGVDLYGDLDNRLLKGLEYHVPRIMELPGFGNPCEPAPIRYTGRWCPIYEMAYNHYHNRRGLECRWLEAALEHTRPEGFWRAYGLSTLTHAGLPPLPAGYNPEDPDPAPPAFTPNYDEQKIPFYTLPEILRTNAGEPVTDKEQWMKVRRPELLEQFENEVYGRVPDAYDSIGFATLLERPGFMNGKAMYRKVEIKVYRNYDSVSIILELVLPSENVLRDAAAPAPSPVFLLINHRGSRNFDPLTDEPSGFFAVDLLVENGYGMAILDEDDVAPDDAELFYTKTIRKLYPEQIRIPNGMMALGAWGWGASRVMDYFESEPLVDPERVAVIGHSRGGKAALWCGAQDQRFAFVISNNSGCGGAALSRRAIGETVARINDRFPHWFCDNFNKYNDREEDLPVDQHMLIALMAPRPVYIASASEDSWADPRGEFLSALSAGEVWALFNRKGLTAAEMPSPDKPVQGGYIGYHLRTGGHKLSRYDWEQYIRFADLRMK